jgi:hypothetical protein
MNLPAVHVNKVTCRLRNYDNALRICRGYKIRVIRIVRPHQIFSALKCYPFVSKFGHSKVHTIGKRSLQACRAGPVHLCLAQCFTFVAENDGEALTSFLAARLICPTGKSVTRVSSPFCKNISLNMSGKSQASFRPSRRFTRGVSRSSRTLVRDAMDAGSFVLTNEVARGRRSRVVLMPRRWHQVSDDALHRGLRRWQTSPVTGESTEETVKTIAQGIPGYPVNLW